MLIYWKPQLGRDIHSWHLQAGATWLVQCGHRPSLTAHMT